MDGGNPEDLGLISSAPLNSQAWLFMLVTMALGDRDGWMLGALCAASLAEMESNSPQLEKCRSSVWEPRVWLEVFIQASEC